MPKGGINFEESNPGGDCGVKKKKIFQRTYWFLTFEVISKSANSSAGINWCTIFLLTVDYMVVASKHPPFEKRVAHTSSYVMQSKLIRSPKIWLSKNWIVFWQFSKKYMYTLKHVSWNKTQNCEPRTAAYNLYQYNLSLYQI